MAKSRYWWVYDPAAERTTPRLIESEAYPGNEEISVINHSFDDPAVALAVLQYYVTFRDDGIMELDMKRVNHPLTWKNKIMLSLRIAPLFALVEVIGLVIALAALILILVHLL